MEEVASTPKLVDPADVDAKSGLTATLPRSDIETALQDEAGADLFLEIARIQNGERDDRTVKVTWSREELEDLLRRASGDAVTLTFKPGRARAAARRSRRGGPGPAREDRRAQHRRRDGGRVHRRLTGAGPERRRRRRWKRRCCGLGHGRLDGRRRRLRFRLHDRRVDERHDRGRSRRHLRTAG